MVSSRNLLYCFQFDLKKPSVLVSAAAVCFFHNTASGMAAPEHFV